MFDNIALDVCIGLIFIYLLYSLLAMIIMELLAQFLDLRAKMLVKTIRVMLDDRDETSGSSTKRFFYHLWQNIYRFWWCLLEDNTFSKVFYAHPNIKYLAQSSWKSKPSGISSMTFATTIISLLRGNDYDGNAPQMQRIYKTLFEHNTIRSGQSKNTFESKIEEETLTHLRELFVDSRRDAELFKALLANWFDETMERTEGWYKKQSQWILLTIGLAIAVAFNIDTIAISRLLSDNKSARESLASIATNATPYYGQVVISVSKLPGDAETQSVPGISNSASQAERSEAIEMMKKDIEKANLILGLGWENKDSCEVCESLEKKLSTVSVKDKPTITARIKKCIEKNFCNRTTYQSDGTLMVIGWILTALAISMGAPFWFDLLNKIVQIRTSIKTTGKEKSTPDPQTTSPGISPENRVG